MASLTKQQALAPYAANAALAEQHVRYYYYFLATCLASAFAGKLLLQAEARWWTRRSSRRGQVDMGYDMSPSPEDMHLRRATLPLLPRLLRAYLAFVRKYLCEVRVAVVGLSVAELAIVLAYVTFLAWNLFVDAPNIAPNPLVHHVVVGFANRAALLAFASLPFTVLLSNKISLVAFLTGISFDRLQFLHRWVGHTTLSLAVVHASAKLSTSHDLSAFRVFGLATLCVVCTMLVFNQRWTMNGCYEVFVSVHAVLVLALVVLAWKHQPAHRHYLIASLSIWGLDRLLRYTRLFIYNGLWRWSGRRASQVASLRLLSHDTTRLELFKGDFPDWQPGAFAFVLTPTLSWWPQSHPFTIASRPPKQACGSKDLGTPSPATAKPSLLSPSSTSQLSCSVKDLMTPAPNLVFLIRARSGWTRRLHELAQRETHPSLPILVDGPYASCPPLHYGFDTVVLFAGGAGLSWTLPLLTDLVERARRGQSAVRRITWICVLRHHVNYDWFFGELESIGHLGSSNLLDLRIHYTSNADDIDMFPHYFYPGRPNIQAIIENAVHESLGRVFVGVSGPLGPSEDVRRHCRLVTSPVAILRGDARGDIYFHSELFGW